MVSMTTGSAAEFGERPEFGDAAVYGVVADHASAPAGRYEIVPRNNAAVGPCQTHQHLHDGGSRSVAAPPAQRASREAGSASRPPSRKRFSLARSISVACAAVARMKRTVQFRLVGNPSASSRCHALSLDPTLMLATATSGIASQCKGPRSWTSSLRLLQHLHRCVARAP